jgi:hypothetical protein
MPAFAPQFATGFVNPEPFNVCHSKEEWDDQLFYEGLDT